MDKIGNDTSSIKMYNHLQNGDLVETGEKPILADISTYEEFFDACQSIAEEQKRNPRMNYGSGTYKMCEMEATDLGMSPDKHIHIQVLDARLHLLKNSDKENKELERSSVLRRTISEDLGKRPVEPIKLSSLIDNGLAMCSEMSILAQAYLEKQGIESYLCDALLFQERSDGIKRGKHHFLAIHDNDRIFIYDPLNTKSTGRPRIMNTGMTKDQFIQKAKNKETFVLDFEPDLKKRNSVFDIGDTAHLGYGRVNRQK